MCLEPVIHNVNSNVCNHMQRILTLHQQRKADQNYQILRAIDTVVSRRMLQEQVEIPDGPDRREPKKRSHKIKSIIAESY